MDFQKENIVTTKNVLIGVGISAVIGALILFFLMWIFGVFGTSKDAEIMKRYNDEKSKNEKIIQLALSEAEKSKKEADILIQKNRELESQLTSRDKKRDEEIKVNDQRRKEENEELEKEHSADIDRVTDMDDSQRNDDICSRLERLAKSNESLAQFKCR